jgi:hypothetical protein
MITRRSFLKIGAIASALLFVPAWQLIKRAVVEEEYQGRVYRGTDDGEIYVSEDQRSTWTRHINLGSQYLVSKLFSNSNDELQVEVDFEGYAFQLKLAPNGKDWLVA